MKLHQFLLRIFTIVCTCLYFASRLEWRNRITNELTFMDFAVNKILKIDLNGNKIHLAGNGEKTQILLSSADDMIPDARLISIGTVSDITGDALENIYFSSCESNRIFAISTINFSLRLVAGNRDGLPGITSDNVIILGNKLSCPWKLFVSDEKQGVYFVEKHNLCTLRLLSKETGTVITVSTSLPCTSLGLSGVVSAHHSHNLNALSHSLQNFSLSAPNQQVSLKNPTKSFDSKGLQTKSNSKIRALVNNPTALPTASPTASFTLCITGSYCNTGLNMLPEPTYDAQSCADGCVAWNSTASYFLLYFGDCYCVFTCDSLAVLNAAVTTYSLNDAPCTTYSPTAVPTFLPSALPTLSAKPTPSPTVRPTFLPSTISPTAPTLAPSDPTYTLCQVGGYCSNYNGPLAGTYGSVQLCANACSEQSGTYRYFFYTTISTCYCSQICTTLSVPQTHELTTYAMNGAQCTTWAPTKSPTFQPSRPTVIPTQFQSVSPTTVSPTSPTAAPTFPPYTFCAIGGYCGNVFATYPGITTAQSCAGLCRNANSGCQYFAMVGSSCYCSGGCPSLSVVANAFTYSMDDAPCRTLSPTSAPTRPTASPTVLPTAIPTVKPTFIPTQVPTAKPSNPSSVPSRDPSSQPSNRPTSQPTRRPTSQPSGHPSRHPSTQPSTRPSGQPSRQPTRQPTSQPTTQPSIHPSSQPSSQPTSRPSTQPTAQPLSRPSSQPTIRPSTQPTSRPSAQPISPPSSHPTRQPSTRPSMQPSSQPTVHPSSQPTRQPTLRPSVQPSSHPSSHPSTQPSRQPTRQPSAQPSLRPTAQPSIQPISHPSTQPTSQPTRQPSSQPSTQPSRRPTVQPTGKPTSQPSLQPSSQPTCHPTVQPTRQPSSQPSRQPSRCPTSQPTMQPTRRPSSQPSVQPSGCPTTQPTSQPTVQPSEQPSSQPSITPTIQPSNFPSSQPTSFPTSFPSSQPSSTPSRLPSSQPSNQPTVVPSCFPTSQPSEFPTSQPTSIPSTRPTVQPSSYPSEQPTTVPSMQPSSSPTSQPSTFPSNQPTNQPSRKPTTQPTSFPTSQPTNKPSIQPSSFPSSQPTDIPSRKPSMQPSTQPTVFPTKQPSCRPTSLPSTQPTCRPSDQPSSRPSSQPTVIPSNQPSSVPTNQPSSLPTSIPSCQPTSCPSIQPFSSPTSHPSSQPTLIPTVQPFAYPTSAPVATIYQTNGVLFWLGATSGSNNTQNDHNDDVLGTSYILFGRNFNHQSRFPFTISLSSPSSREFASEISQNEGGIRHDLTTRSTTILGDVNGDGFNDLLVGYPLASKCSVYLGNGVDDFATLIATSGESFAIVGDPYDGGGFLGWSSIRIGDLNSDGLDEIIVSAIFANTVYVIYGRREFSQRNVKVNELTAGETGFKIVGHPDEINFGVSLILIHDFRKGSRADIAITAQTASDGQNVIYILFGGVVFKDNTDVYIEQIMNNPSTCFKIIAPPFSYAGFSLAGIGDINSDGHDDLAIGSVPYRRGKYSTQSTYVIYGKSITANNKNELQLSTMGPDDGFIITGGGFLVIGVGDVNSDSIHDMMITEYYNWKDQSCAYVIMSPRNMTYSPSLQPSSRPTATTFATPSNMNGTQTSNNSSEINQNSSSTGHKPLFRPSRTPSRKPNSSPTIEPTRLDLAVGTAHPTPEKPSLSPTITPTSGYHRLRGFAPSLSPSLMPTINITTDYTEMDCSKGGDYSGMNETNFKFSITASSGFVTITGNDYGGAKNLYVLYCPSDPVNVVIKNFRLTTDILSVAHLVEAGYAYRSLDDIPYSLKSGSLTLFFCAENKLQLDLASHKSFDLSETNFLFLSKTSTKQTKSGKVSTLAQAQIGVAFGVLAVFCFIIFVITSTQNTGSDQKPSNFPKLHVPLPIEEDSHDSSSTNTSLSGLLRGGWQQSPSTSEENESNDDENDSNLSNSLTISNFGLSKHNDEEERSESLPSVFLNWNLNSDSDEEGIEEEDGDDDDSSNGSSAFDLSDEEISSNDHR
jgi:hypothetical protein